MVLVVAEGMVAVKVGFGCGRGSGGVEVGFGRGGGWVGAVIGYICSWGCGVCSCGGREKETRGERDDYFLLFY